jgi:hypothetical protein
MPPDNTARTRQTLNQKTRQYQQQHHHDNAKKPTITILQCARRESATPPLAATPGKQNLAATTNPITKQILTQLRQARTPPPLQTQSQPPHMPRLLRRTIQRTSQPSTLARLAVLHPDLGLPALRRRRAGLAQKTLVQISERGG